MSISELYSNGSIRKKVYSNGQLAIHVNDVDGQPFAELSISKESVHLDNDEFILKDYSENTELVEKLVSLGAIELTDRFVLVGSHVCPICKVLI